LVCFDFFGCIVFELMGEYVECNRVKNSPIDSIIIDGGLIVVLIETPSFGLCA
jgi:hypothetical protein